MAILEIIKDPHEVLRKKCKPVTKVSAAIRQLLDDMAETMYAAPGVGLAAPQVGVAKRIIVLDQQDEEGSPLYQLINPEIVYKEGWVNGTEGCLSIPGLVGDVYRHEKVRVEALDRQGKKVYIEATGWLARIFQHEIDHLDGVLYTDTATNVREVKPGTEEEVEAEEARTRAVEQQAAGVQGPVSGPEDQPVGDPGEPTVPEDPGEATAPEDPGEATSPMEPSEETAPAAPTEPEGV